MLPASFQTPAAVILLVGGLISCFAGYRVFRIVLGIYGFILGALVASSAMGTEHTAWMIGAALVGGVVGALILIVAYFVGVALLGAAIGAGAAAAIWASFHSEPGLLIVVLFATAGALAAMALQRYVIIGSTAFGGAWTAMIGIATLMGDRQTAAAATKHVWLAYPMDPAPGARWMYIAALVVGLVGVVIQLRAPNKKK
jgi:Domain of unknown function (DUF4203)